MADDSIAVTPFLPLNEHQEPGSYDSYIRHALKDTGGDAWIIGLAHGLHALNAWNRRGNGHIAERLGNAVEFALHKAAEHLPEHERTAFIENGRRYFGEMLDEIPLEGVVLQHDEQRQHNPQHNKPAPARKRRGIKGTLDDVKQRAEDRFGGGKDDKK